MIDKNRKRAIDDLVIELKIKYDTKSLEGLKQLSKDKGISVIEDDKVIIPSAYKFVDGQRYILLQKEKNLSKRFSFGHELGHHLSDYLFNQPGTEREASYFSEQLTGEKEPIFYMIVDGLFIIMKNPFLSVISVFFPYLSNKDSLKIIKRYNSQKEKTI